MNYHPIFSIAFYVWFFTYPLFCFAQTSNESSQSQLKDFHILKNALIENESGLYLYVDSLEMANIFNDTERELQNQKSELELFRIFSGLISKIKCGHTQVLPSKNIINEFFNQASTLPLEVKLVNNRLFVTRDFLQGQKIQKNDEIISINNKCIADLLKEIHHLISSDGNNDNFKNKQIEDYFLLYYFLSENIPQSFNLVVINKDNDSLKVILPPVFPNIIDYRSKEHNNSNKQENESVFGNLKIMKSANYGVLTLPDFNKSAGRKHKKFIDDCFGKINKSGVEHLIIDLKDNYGGKNQYYLTSYLAHNEIEYGYYKTKGVGKPTYNSYLKKFNRDYLLCRLALHRNKKAYDNNKPIPIQKTSLFGRPESFKGKIYVLINGNTFSAASNLASNLKEKCNAVLIGEESGGGYKQGNTGRLRLVLPKSKLTVIINPIYYNNMPINQLQNEDGVVPHYYVKENYPIKKNADAYMKQALKLILSHPESNQSVIIHKQED